MNLTTQVFTSVAYVCAKCVPNSPRMLWLVRCTFKKGEPILALLAIEVFSSPRISFDRNMIVELFRLEALFQVLNVLVLATRQSASLQLIDCLLPFPLTYAGIPKLARAVLPRRRALARQAPSQAPRAPLAPARALQRRGAAHGCGGAAGDFGSRERSPAPLASPRRVRVLRRSRRLLLSFCTQWLVEMKA